MEQECADSCEKQGDRYVQTCKQGHENCGSKHGKQMLEAKNQHVWRAQLTCIIDGILWFHYLKRINSSGKEYGAKIKHISITSKSFK